MKQLLSSWNVASKAMLIVVLLTGMSACVKELYDPATAEGEGDKEVTLDTYFDFSTTKSVELNVDYGKDCPKAYFEIYAENPFEVKDGQVVKRVDLFPIATGFTNIDGVYNKKASITASVSELYIYSPDFGVPTLFTTNLNGNTLEAKISFDNAIDISTLVGNGTRTAATRASLSTIKANIPNTLGTWNNNNGKPNYLENSLKISVDETLKSYISTYFRENVEYTGSWITDNADITIYKDANISINYLGGTTGAKSVFAYYCYDVNATKAEIQKAASKACVIFPNAHQESLDNYSGVGVKLLYIDAEGNLAGDRFPANTKIGFLLWNNGWTNGNNGPFNRNVFYSTSSLNSDNKSHTAVFGAQDAKGKAYNVITMEDWDDFDLNDLAFVINSNPIEAIVTPPASKPGDRKGTDIYRGLLAFEDNWPAQGDYDMNDVVMKYVSNIDYNSDNRIVAITDKLTLAWTGASFKNGFAYEVPYDLSRAKVTVSGADTYRIRGNVIYLFEDARAMLGVSDIDPKDMASHVVPEKAYTVSVQFENPSIGKETVVPPYNPFITRFGGSLETHLTNYKPSAFATNEFPQGADIADGKTTFFVCKDGFPFAFHIDGRTDKEVLNINLKEEGKRIDKVFPKFGEWAKTKNPVIKWWKK